MMNGSFTGFTPPPHASSSNQPEFNFTSEKPKRDPVVLEAFSLSVSLLETKKICDEYTKKGFLGKLFGAPLAVTKIIDLNNQLNERILIVNRNGIKIHAALEDFATDFEQLEKDLKESKDLLKDQLKEVERKAGEQQNDHALRDRISSMEIEQRQLKLAIGQMRNAEDTSPKPYLWFIGAIVVNILVTYGIVNSFN